MAENVRTDSVFNLLILLGKMYIYKNKYDKCIPNLPVFEGYLYPCYKIEEHNAKLAWKTMDFKAKWLHYQN